MELDVTKQDILGCLEWINVNFNLGLDIGIVMFDSCVTLGEGVTIKKTLPVGSISMQVAIRAVDGCLELNIQNAQLLGLNWFGVLRKKAGDVLLSILAPYQHIVKSSKYTDGNIRLQLPVGQITSATCVNGVLSLGVALPT